MYIITSSRLTEIKYKEVLNPGLLIFIVSLCTFGAVQRLIRKPHKRDHADLGSRTCDSLGPIKMSFPKGGKSVQNKITNQKLEVVGTEAVKISQFFRHIHASKTTSMLQFP